jgi:hypothetical protein
LAKKLGKITIEKEKIRPKERAPIIPSRTIEDKRRKEARRPKHKKSLLRETSEDGRSS